MSFNSFTVDTTVGSKAQLSVALQDNDTVKATIGEFITIPGAVQDISYNMSGHASVMGGSDLTLGVTLRDRFGNLVGDDTSVNIRVSGDAELDDYEAGTRNGVVTATITGGMEPGDYEAFISAGELADTIVPFTVYPYTLTFESPTDRVQLGAAAEFVVKAVNHRGQSAPAGLPLQVFAVKA